MVEQANVFVQNDLTEAIRAVRYLPGGDSDLDLSIDGGSNGTVLLPDLQVWLEVTPPNGKGTVGYSLVVETNENLVECLNETVHWTIRIKENTAFPEAPTTVNVTVGTDGP